ncbi:hypothetical protein KR018_003727, partial [Drosophila ironensis]
PADQEKFVLLPCKSVYTVGRLSTDLVIAEDLSVSRTHVKFHLKAGEDAALEVEDLGSRYGTYLYPANAQEARKLVAKKPFPVPVGVRVRFGGNASIWQVTQLRIVTTASALTRAEVQELETLLEPLGGAVAPTWTEQCTHLTMNEVSVTVKLLHALLENKPIVTFAYWRSLLQAAQRVHVKEGWPLPEEYQPTNMDVRWRPERTRLFAGKTFVFMNRKHFEIYGTVVQKAGATCKDLNSGVRKTFLTKKDVIVIQYVPSTQSQATETINSIQVFLDILEQAGLRIIQEYEIGMALINCSAREFCNPLHKFASESMPTTESMTSSLAFNSSILAPSTEKSGGPSSAPAMSELVIPESDEVVANPTPQTSKSVALKRVHEIASSDEEMEKTSKRSKRGLQKGRKAITVDSSSEEEAAKPPARVIAARGNPVFVDSSDEENQRAKQNTAPAVPPVRASSRPKPSAEAVAHKQPKKRAAEPEEQQVEMPAKKPKPRQVLSVASDNDDEDNGEGPFQFRKTPETAKRVASAKPNPPSRISVANFLEKSQPKETIPVGSGPHSQSQSQSQSLPRKRARLELLNESDSDDCDNPFNFGDSKKPRKSHEHASKADDSNEGLFNFDSENHNGNLNEDDMLTEPFPSAVEAKPKSKYILPQRKELPRRVDVSGWLSCSRLHEDVKPEPNASIKPEEKPDVKLELSVKEESDELDDNKAHLKWLASMNDGIQVRMCNLNITNRSQEEVDGSVNDSASKYGGRKNFKKFVKTANPHPQKRIVVLKRLQLTDGMVTCI